MTFRPDLNAERMEDSARRLEMPVFPKERFLEAVDQVVLLPMPPMCRPTVPGLPCICAPTCSAAMAVIGVKPSHEYQFRLFATPVGPYFKGGAKPITIRVCDYDRAAPHGTGHIKAGLNYAMSLYAIMEPTEKGTMKICIWMRPPGPRWRRPAAQTLSL